jgi:hypothetical protein
MAGKRGKANGRGAGVSPGGGPIRSIGHPVFAQPQSTPDPGTFRIKHASDKAAYASIDQLNKLHKIQATPFPPPRGGTEPQLTLQQVLGGDLTVVKAIAKQGQIVFHATGDCGSTRGPKTEVEVADKMISDMDEADPKEVPRFNFLLGDVVYSFGEAQYYYDQFYEPYRDYPAPILAVAGNHDGMVAPGTNVDTLAAFLRNFCAESFVVTEEAGGLSRTAQIQPGVFFTFDAPFVRILALYSNSLEDPGVIANGTIGNSQIAFLTAALGRAKAQAYPGAILLAFHHPPYTPGLGQGHGGSPQMLADIDKVCDAVGLWPHAVLAGHVHNYQRFTRTRPDGTQIPYVSCGNGGHNVLPVAGRGKPPIRAPQVVQAASRGVDQVVFENYDDQHYGYLRVIVTSAQLRIEYHSASDGPNAKAPDDSVTIDLATRTIAHFAANDLGHPAAARAVRQKKKNLAT